MRSVLRRSFSFTDTAHMLAFRAERNYSQSGGGLWEDVTTLQNINFNPVETETKISGGGER